MSGIRFLQLGLIRIQNLQLLANNELNINNNITYSNKNLRL